MRRPAAIALAVLALAAGAAPAYATPSQDSFGVTQARADAPGLDGAGLVVAVVDTGVDASHPALAGKVIHTEDLVGPEHNPCPDFGHGTWVAGIIAGRETADLDAGVAPGAEIVAVDVIDSCNDSSIERIAAGIQWVVDNRATYGIDVINLSIGDPVPGGPEIDAAEAAVARAVAAGVSVVAVAGGRRGLGNVVSPGSAEQALTVGAMADQFTPADLGGPGFSPLLFSSAGPTAAAVLKPDVMGPASHVAAKPGKPAGDAGSGTSGAAAFTSGVALLMLDANPALTPAALKAAIMTTARDWGRPGADEDYGAGRLDAYAALAAAGAPLGPAPAGLGHRTLAGRAAAGEPVEHQVVVADAGAPLVATVVPDPPDRLPAAPAGELALRLQGPGGVDVTAPAHDRRRTAAVAAPAPGTYTLTVTGANAYALDVSGALAAPAAAPAVTLDAPAAFTNDPTPALEGSAAGAGGVAVRIYRDGVQVRSLWTQPSGRWAAEPTVPLPPGTYEVGAEQGGPATPPGRSPRATFTIDTTRPNTTVDRVGDTLTFGASEPVSGYQCSVDGAAFGACGSPMAVPDLAPGDHWLEVRAVDLADNVDASPARYEWIVPSPPPSGNDPPASNDDPPASGNDPPASNGDPPASNGGASPARDLDRPELALASALPRGLAPLRRRGLRLRVHGDEPCAIRVELRLAAKLAKRLELPRRLARKTVRLDASGTVEVQLRPGKRARKRLRRVKSLELQLVVVAADAAGNKSRLSRSLRLR